MIDDGPLSPFLGRSSSASSFHASLLQAIDVVMSLALCSQILSQTPQHFRSSETQTTCEGCFARQSICLVISLHSSLSRAVHPQEFTKVDVDQWHIPVWFPIPLFTFYSKLIETLKQSKRVIDICLCPRCCIDGTTLPVRARIAYQGQANNAGYAVGNKVNHYFRGNAGYLPIRTLASVFGRRGGRGCGILT